MEKDKIVSFTDFCDELESRKKDDTWMAKLYENDSLSYYSFYQFNDIPDSKPSLSSAIRIFSDMKVEVFVNLNTSACLDPLPYTTFDWLFWNRNCPMLNAWVQFDNLLTYVSAIASHQDAVNDVHIKEELIVYSNTGNATYDEDDDDGDGDNDEQNTLLDKELFAERLALQAAYRSFDGKVELETDTILRQVKSTASNIGDGDQDERKQSSDTDGLHGTCNADQNEWECSSISNEKHGISEASQSGWKKNEQTIVSDDANIETTSLCGKAVGKQEDMDCDEDSQENDIHIDMKQSPMAQSSQDSASIVGHEENPSVSVSQASSSSTCTPDEMHFEKSKVQDISEKPVGSDIDGHFGCFFCPNVFAHSSIRDIHMKTLHYCNYLVSAVDTDEDGSGQQQQKHYFICELCKTPFESKSSLVCHKKLKKCTLTFVTLIICDVCGLPCKGKKRLTEHMNVHTRPYKCSLCPKSFSNKRILRRHLRVHTGEKPYECSECIASFSDKSSLVRHQRIHTGEKPYTCEVCNKSFRKMWNLKLHKQTHISVENKTIIVKRRPAAYKKKIITEKNFVCELCGEAYYHKDSLALHLLKHTGIKPYSCDICGKAFYSKQNARRHKIIHTGESSYQCSLCDRAFPCNYRLDQHMRRHTGERPFKCENCTRTFFTITEFNRHRETHSELKPYVCEICDRSFKTKRGYWQHKKVHSDERPFQCEICSKGFKAKKNLNRHARIHLRTQEQSCKNSVCD